PPRTVAVWRVLDRAPADLGRALACMRGQARCSLATPDGPLSYTGPEASRRTLPIILRHSRAVVDGTTVPKLRFNPLTLHKARDRRRKRTVHGWDWGQADGCAR